MTRTLVISDIHGCYDEFMNLLEVVKYQQGVDELILLGDYVDRGFKSKEVLEFIREIKDVENVHVLLGNHDYEFMELLKTHHRIYNQSFFNDDSLYRYIRSFNHWLYNWGGKNTLQSFIDDDSTIIDYTDGLKLMMHILSNYRWAIKLINDMDYYYEDSNHIYVHAGVEPFKKELKNMNKESFINIRYEFLDNKHIQDRTVVFGHTPTINLQETEDIWIDLNSNKIGIDGGCAFGMQLNCLAIEQNNEDKRVFYKEYFEFSKTEWSR